MTRLSIITILSIILSFLTTSVSPQSPDENYVFPPWAPISQYCKTRAACQPAYQQASDTRSRRYSAGDTAVVLIHGYYVNQTMTLKYLTDKRNLNTKRNQGQNVTTDESVFTALYGARCYEDTCYDNVTSIFFPKVDELSYLTIPNSTDLVRKLDESRPFKIWVELFYNGLSYSTSEDLPFYAGTTRGKSVEFRSVIVSLKDGNVSTIRWERTNCKFDVGNCLWDATYNHQFDMLAECEPDNAKAPCQGDASIYVMWSGTDRNGKKLTSASYSVFKFRNVFGLQDS